MNNKIRNSAHLFLLKCVELVLVLVIVFLYVRFFVFSGFVSSFIRSYASLNSQVSLSIDSKYLLSRLSQYSL